MKKIFIIFICLILLCGCGKYKSYDKTVLVTLVTSISETVTNVTTKTIITKSNDMIVYFTKSGECYHYNNPCGRGTYYECTLEEAIDKGLKPCGKCVE